MEREGGGLTLQGVGLSPHGEGLRLEGCGSDCRAVARPLGEGLRLQCEGLKLKRVQSVTGMINGRSPL